METDSENIGPVLYVNFVIAIVGIISHIIFLIACFKAKKMRFHQFALLIQFLFVYILYTISTIMPEFEQVFNWEIECEYIEFVRSFSAVPRLTSALCIVIDFYLSATNRLIFKTKKILLLVLYSLFIWTPSTVLTILGVFVIDKYHEFCMVTEPRFFRITLFVITALITLVTSIVCIVLIHKLCKIEIQDNELLQVKRDKQIRKLVLFVIGIAILAALIWTFLFGNVIPESTVPYLSMFRSFVIFVMNYIFVWNKYTQEVFANICPRCKCLQNNPNKSIQVSQEIAEIETIDSEITEVYEE